MATATDSGTFKLGGDLRVTGWASARCGSPAPDLGRAGRPRRGAPASCAGCRPRRRPHRHRRLLWARVSEGRSPRRAPRPQGAGIATKGGLTRSGQNLGPRRRPEYLVSASTRACAGSGSSDRPLPAAPHRPQVPARRSSVLNWRRGAPARGEGPAPRTLRGLGRGDPRPASASASDSVKPLQPRHPHAAAVLDFGEENGLGFIPVGPAVGRVAGRPGRCGRAAEAHGVSPTSRAGLVAPPLAGHPADPRDRFGRASPRKCGRREPDA